MGDNMIKLEQFEMLRSMYNFTATYAKTLSFKENEYFILHQTSTKERNWWQVVNRLGQLGFVPSNYVEAVKVKPDFFRKFLDDCVGVLNSSDSDSSDTSVQLNIGRQELIARLKEKRRQAGLSSMESDTDNQKPLLDLLYHTGKSDGDHNARSSDSSVEPQTVKEINKHCSANKGQGEGPIDNISVVENKLQEIGGSKLRHTNSEPQYCDTSVQVPESLPEFKKSSSSPVVQIRSPDTSSDLQPIAVYSLIDAVRRDTDLSFKMSRVAVATVVSELQQLLPNSTSTHLGAIIHRLQHSINTPESYLLGTHDAQRLHVIFSELSDCKDDSEQRSWMLHEDEAVITEYISELISILSNADSKICCLVMAKDEYDGLVALVQYYQMEIRWTIRQLLLQAFGVMCSLSFTALKVMLCSVLPEEVARDMMSNSRNIPRLHYSGLLLTMLFSMGENSPITHFEFIGKDFITFILKLMESPPDTDVDDKIPDLCLNLSLSYNLQFCVQEENIFIQALEEQTVANTFTEKILLLLNREEDPIKIFDHEPAPAHSVLKLFIDIFGSQTCALLFYTNDIKVLIDIIVRQLSDLSPGDQKRQQYLELIRRVLRNSNYSEHFHRRDDLLKVFTRIFCEESDASIKDQQLVREISNEFPQYFKA